MEEDHYLREELIPYCTDWAISHGLASKKSVQEIVNNTKAPPQLLTQAAPFALSPSPIPKSCFDLALELQPIWHLILDSLAALENHDAKEDDTAQKKDKVVGGSSNFIRSHLVNDQCLGKCKGDVYVQRMLDIYERVLGNGQQHGGVGPVQLAIVRIDYMLDYEPFNTIAASMGHLAGQASSLHHNLSQDNRYRSFIQRDLQKTLNSSSPASTDNNPSREIGKAILSAHQLLCQAKGQQGGVILFVVQEGERNVYDQRFIEFSIKEGDPNVIVVRLSLAQIHDRCTIDPSIHLVILKDIGPVTVAYFRAGYTPSDYPTEKEWNALEMLEKSHTVCCPSMVYQLIGFKKVQEILALKAHLLNDHLPREKYSAEEQASILSKLIGTFAPFHAFNGNDVDSERTIDLIKREPEKFVLKPMREGGGNNIYGKDIIPFLESHVKPDDRSSFVVMELIRSPAASSSSSSSSLTFPSTANYFVRAGEVTRVEKTISEFGIYGAILTTKLPGSTTQFKVVENRVLGHLVRTKSLGVNEGGVAAGFSVIDSPLLF